MVLYKGKEVKNKRDKSMKHTKEVDFLVKFVNDKTGEVSEEFDFLTLEKAKAYAEKVKHLIKGTTPKFYEYINKEWQEVKE